MVSKAKNVVAEFGPAAAKKCFDEEAERCIVKHEIAGMIPALLGYERQGQLLGGLNAAEPETEDKNWADARAYGWQLAQKCFQWDLMFSSTGNFRTGGDGFDSSVSAKIPIRMQGGAANLFDLMFTGKSALVNEHFEFLNTIEDCTVTSNRGGGEFEVFGLGWETVLRQDPDGEPRFYVKDFILQYYPGNTSESFFLDCVDSEGKPLPRFNVPPAPMWTGTFIMTHYKETAEGEAGQAPPAASIDELMQGIGPKLSAGQAFVMKAWKVNAAQTLGTKTWQGSSDLDPDVFEGGEFELIHRPQP
jgi:hypothetical protein